MRADVKWIIILRDTLSNSMLVILLMYLVRFFIKVIKFEEKIVQLYRLIMSIYIVLFDYSEIILYTYIVYV